MVERSGDGVELPWCHYWGLAPPPAGHTSGCTTQCSERPQLLLSVVGPAHVQQTVPETPKVIEPRFPYNYHTYFSECGSRIQ